MLKQGEMSVMDYEREFLRLSKYSLELMPTKRRELIKEFVDLAKRAKIVEQALGLDKKFEFSQAIRKRARTSSLYHTSKQAKETREYGRMTSRFSRLDRAQDCQPSVSVGSVRGPTIDSEIPSCVHCGKKHQSEYWKLTKTCFRCGSLEHFARDCPKNEDASPVIA
ncbi:Gag-Pol polyprotein [Gossypium australe]|uniref:Gag-Pol polyprotein n=1 Tax=Gossypium australe TaxID=47621 RepID=A0A5B6X3Y1_9ROSI|nr:Gag-Pol polyprotein [Gossypium australe]